MSGSGLPPARARPTRLSCVVLAVEGGEGELEAGRNRRAAAEALFEAMDDERVDLDLAAIDRLDESTPG